MYVIQLLTTDSLTKTFTWGCLEWVCLFLKASSRRLILCYYSKFSELLSVDFNLLLTRFSEVGWRMSGLPCHRKPEIHNDVFLFFCILKRLGSFPYVGSEDLGHLLYSVNVPMRLYSIWLFGYGAARNSSIPNAESMYSESLRSYYSSWKSVNRFLLDILVICILTCQIFLWLVQSTFYSVENLSVILKVRLLPITLNFHFENTNL